jgi:hypothetical protein
MTTPFMALCSLMTRPCASAVRGLDQDFAPCQFDDGDLYVRCQLAGFAPHGVGHLVGHPEGRTSVTPDKRHEDIERMHAHHRKFIARWGLADSPVPASPVHVTCPRCAMPRGMP